MRRIERFTLVLTLALALAAFLRVGLPLTPAAAAHNDSSDQSIAVCSITGIIDELMDTDRFKPERIDFEKKTREEILGDIAEKLSDLQDKVQGMDRSSDDFAKAREEYFRLQGEANARQQKVRTLLEQQVTKQLIECRKLALASARAVADDLGFDYVIASEGAQRPFPESGVKDLIIDFLSRPMLVHPEDADITEDVRSDLKLP